MPEIKPFDKVLCSSDYFVFLVSTRFYFLLTFKLLNLAFLLASHKSVSKKSLTILSQVLTIILQAN